jgi:hypothetical protein
MRGGSDEQRQEQWKKMGDIMAKFSEHAKDFKPEDGQNWNRCFKDDGNGNSWNSLRAKVQRIPEGVLEACPGTSLIEEIEVLNDTSGHGRKDVSSHYTTSKHSQSALLKSSEFPSSRKSKASKS